MNIHFVVPDLFWPDLDQIASLDCMFPGLAGLLGRADEKRFPSLPYESVLASLFLGQQPHYPFAALSLLGESGQFPEGHWLRADPVHLHLIQQGVVLTDAKSFDLSHAEADVILRDLNQMLSGRGQFLMINPSIWYLKLKEPISFSAMTLSSVVGQRIYEQLPLEESCRSLRHMLNEIQIFLFDHPVNQQREEKGQEPINSLWFWGEGELIGQSSAQFDLVHADTPIARGLAHHAGIEVKPLPADSRFLNAVTKNSHVLIVDERFSKCVAYGDFSVWKERFVEFDRNWLMSLYKATGFSIGCLTFETTGTYGHFVWYLDRNRRWRFWRKRKSLSQYLSAF